MSFFAHWQKLNWDALSLTLYSKTAADVEAALAKKSLDDDFMALVSPAAEAYS